MGAAREWEELGWTSWSDEEGMIETLIGSSITPGRFAKLKSVFPNNSDSPTGRSLVAEEFDNFLRVMRETVGVGVRSVSGK